MPTHAKWGPALRLDPIRIAKKLPPGSHECCLSDAPGLNTARDFSGPRGVTLYTFVKRFSYALLGCLCSVVVFGFSNGAIGLWSVCGFAVMRFFALCHCPGRPIFKCLHH